MTHHIYLILNPNSFFYQETSESSNVPPDGIRFIAYLITMAPSLETAITLESRFGCDEGGLVMMEQRAFLWGG